VGTRNGRKLARLAEDGALLIHRKLARLAEDVGRNGRKLARLAEDTRGVAQ